MVKRKGRFKSKRASRIITKSTTIWQSEIASSKCTGFVELAVISPQINFHQLQSQFERERRLVSFNRYVEIKQPQPNADHSDNEENVGIGVNIEVERGAQVNNRSTIVWHSEIASSKCIRYVGRCMLLGKPIDDIFTTQMNR